MDLTRHISVFSFAALLLLSGLPALATHAPGPSTQDLTAAEYIYIHLENKCSEDLSYEVKYPGQSFKGTIHANSKRRITVRVGAEVIVDGEYFRDVSAVDDGKTFVICK